MLRIFTRENADEPLAYHHEDLAEEDTGPTDAGCSSWVGQAAARLGLTGRVHCTAYRRLGKEAGEEVRQTRPETAGKFCFSSPRLLAVSAAMTVGQRLKSLRTELGLSQDAMGAQGFVSTPGWIKIENGQRAPGDRLLMRLVSWLLREEHFGVSSAGALLEELFTLKYLYSSSAFVRKLARNHAKVVFPDTAILVSEDPAVYRTRRHRRAASTSRKAH